MDGYHFDDVILEARGDRPRKGAPHTFDAAGFYHLLTRLRGDEPEVALLVFDRAQGILPLLVPVSSRRRSASCWSKAITCC